MADAMKIRATMDGDVADVKVLIQHKMDTGLIKDKNTGKLIPAHYINNVVVTLNGKTVMEAQWGPAISTNPFIGIRVKGAKSGDKVSIHAVDNLDMKYDGEAVVS